MTTFKRTRKEDGTREAVTPQEMELIEAKIEAGRIYKAIAAEHDLNYGQVSVIARKRRERLGLPPMFWAISEARSLEDVLLMAAIEATEPPERPEQ